MSLPQQVLDQILALLASCPADADADESAKLGDGDHIRRLTRLLTFHNGDAVVDSALSMIGFTTSTMMISLSSCLVQSLITVLSSTITRASQTFLDCLDTAVSKRGFEYTTTFTCGDDVCPNRPLQHDFEKVYFGAALSPNSVREIVETSVAFLRRVKLDENLAMELLEVLIKITSMICSSKSSLLGSCLVYEREGLNEAASSQATASSIIELLIQFALERKEALYNKFSPLVRLLLWRLQPELLKQDLSSLLQKVAERPLLSLKNELRHGNGSYNLTVAMTFGPDIFREARRTLNAWMLASGAPCVWELDVELGAAVRDVLEKPCSWGLSVEEGASLPPLPTFYHPSLQSALIILSRLPTLSGLRALLSLFNKEVSLVGHPFSYCEEVFQPEATKSGLHIGSMEQANKCPCVLQESLWALVMDFPLWLQFASLSLFQWQCTTHQISGNCDYASVSSGCSVSSMTSDAEGLANLSRQEIAARYLGWLFSPYDEGHREHTVKALLQIANSWQCIADGKCIADCTRHDNSTMKKQRLMIDNSDKPDAVAHLQKPLRVENACCNVQCFSGNKYMQFSSVSCNEVVQAVQQWLTDFRCCFSALDNLICQDCRSRTVTEERNQTKRRLLLIEDSTETMDRIESGLPVDSCTKHSMGSSASSRLSTLLDTLPLAALAISPGLQIDAVGSIILRCIMAESDGVTCRGYKNEAERRKVSDDEYGAHLSQAGNISKNGLIFKEPSHRTEDFKDLCSVPLCSDSSCHVSWTIGAATIFKFLETIDLHEVSEFMNGNSGLVWLSGFKEVLAKQLTAYIRHWCEHADIQNLTLLDDLQQRASLWAVQAGLDSTTLRNLNQVLQGLDILISSSLVDA